jgi:hypothetical protein
MKYHLHFLIFLFFILPTLLQGQGDGDMSLGTIIAPRPKVLGLAFDDGVTEVDVILKQMKMSPIKGPKTKSNSALSYKIYSGVPPGLWIQKGKSQFVYFNNKLIRMDFTFDPTYANFLLIRNQLMHSLGERFNLEEKKESMDNFLKSHLANLQSDEYSERTEREIISALKRGKTFYYYSLADNKDEMNVTLSFSASQTMNGEAKPKLILHYSSKRGLERLVEYEKIEKTKILPE